MEGGGKDTASRVRRQGALCKLWVSEPPSVTVMRLHGRCGRPVTTASLVLDELFDSSQVTATFRSLSWTNPTLLTLKVLHVDVHPLANGHRPSTAALHTSANFVQLTLLGGGEARAALLVLYRHEDLSGYSCCSRTLVWSRGVIACRCCCHRREMACLSHASCREGSSCWDSAVSEVHELLRASEDHIIA